MNTKNAYRGLCAGLLLLTQLAQPAPTHAIITGTGAYACPDGLVMRVTEDDLNAPPPKVSFSIAGGPAGEVGPAGESVITVKQSDNSLVTTKLFIYWIGAKLTGGAKGNMAAQQANNARYSTFKVDGVCPPSSSVRGVAFEDRNANGVREAGEPLLYDAHYKITGGGDWFVCGYVGSDATYGVPVKPGIYYVIPLSLRGWRTTTPRLRAIIDNFNFAALNNDIGYVRDAYVKDQACDQYNPPSPMATATPIPLVTMAPTPKPPRRPRRPILPLATKASHSAP